MKKNIMGIYLLLAFLMASCLPQEKTTQCDSNEAYNATTRSCVATLGASSATVNIANITPASSYSINASATSKTHSISVSDQYNNGYTVKWNLTQPNGSVALLSTGLSLTFNHTIYPTGSYILEVQLLDSAGVSIHDSRSWSVNIIAQTVPTITVITPTPFATDTTNSATTIDVTAINPDSLNVDYQWWVNGTQVAGESGSFSSTTLTTLDFDFNPTSTVPANTPPLTVSNGNAYHVGSGIYTVQLVLTKNGSTDVYSSHTWTISNNIPGFANASLGTSDPNNVGNGFQTATPPVSATIMAIVDTDISLANSFLSDVDNNNTLDSIDFCVQVDNVAGVDNQGVWVDFLEDGSVVGSARMNTNNEQVCLGDLTGDGTFDNNFQVNIVNNFVFAESTTISAVIYDEYSGSSSNPAYSTGTLVERYDWPVTKRRANTPPVVTIDTETVVSSETTKIQYDSNGDNVTDTSTCVVVSSTSQTGCTITQDLAFDVAINIADDDYDSTAYSQFQVEFEVDGVDLDGATPTVSATDCYHTTVENNTSAKLLCSLTINSYDSATGPIDAATANYTITAKVTDSGSPYGGAAVESNSVSWTISTVKEINTNISINPFVIDGSANVLVDSYIAMGGASAIPIDVATANLKEGNQIVFAINIDDPERDSHTIAIHRCDSSKVGGCEANVTEQNLVTKVITSTDATNPRLSYLNYTIGEDDVVGATTATVDYIVSVTDTATIPITKNAEVSFPISDNNVDPVFNDTFSPVTGSTYTAFVGFPFSFDVGSVTDASIVSDSDGDEIVYQWMLSTSPTGAAGTWLPINGATKSTLIWSPSSELDFSGQEGTAVKVKLCVGDNGWDSNINLSKTAMNVAGDDCSDVTSADRDSSQKEKEWDITVYSNISQGYGNTTNTSSGPIAVWVDPTSTNPLIKYLAYQNTSQQLVVEKIVTTAAGTKHGTTSTATAVTNGFAEVSTIVFNSTSTAANDITHLSMTGDSVNKALYLSYMAPYDGAAGADSVHVRRIDISGGKTGLTHDGKFGINKDHDGLTDDIIVTSTEIAAEVVNADGLIELDVQGIDANTTVLNFNGITSGSLTLTEGTEFCATACTTTTEMADSIVSAINTSTHFELQGITATQTSDVVLLSGIAESDYIQLNINAIALGQIVVNQKTLKWELPYINAFLSGAEKNKISIFHDDLNERLNEGSVVSTKIASTSQAQEISNDLDPNNKMILATRGLFTGTTAIYEITTDLGPTYTVNESTTDVFGVSTITDLKVVVGKTTANTSAYLVGKNTANNEIAYARFDSVAGDYDITTSPYASVDLDSNFAMFDDTANYDISAGPQAYELFIGSVDITDQALYILRVSGQTTPQIDCNYDQSGMAATTNCQKIRSSSAATVGNLPIAMSDVFENVTLGDAGDTASENIKDIMVFAYHEVAAPTLGIINVEQTTLSGTGGATNQDKIYNIPYVSN
jgi:hypothetical protein